jgi:hypothetical protein
MVGAICGESHVPFQSRPVEPTDPTSVWFGGSFGKVKTSTKHPILAISRDCHRETKNRFEWDVGMSENGVYPQWNSHLVGIMISKTIGCRGTLFSDKPMLKGGMSLGCHLRMWDIDGYWWILGLLRPHGGVLNGDLAIGSNGNIIGISYGIQLLGYNVGTSWGYHEDIMIGIYCQDMGYGVYINGALRGLDRFYWDV